MTTVTTTVGSSWAGDTQVIEPDHGTVGLLSGDPLRRSATILSDPDSIGTLYLVPNAGQRDGGVRIVPGAGFVFDNAAPIYAYASGGDVTVTTVVETGAQC